MSYNRDLAPNMTRDLKVERHPQAIVKLNAQPNMEEYRRRKEFDKDKKQLYSTNPLEGEMADAKFLLADGDLAYVMLKDKYKYPKSSDRTFMNQDLGMKVNTALNGLGGDADAIDDLIEPCGFIEMGNEETRTAKTNLIRGGGLGILYNGVKPARENAWLRARAPTANEAKLMKADKASHARGVDGVVTLMFEEYNPPSITFLSVEKLAKIFKAQEDGEKDSFSRQTKEAIDALLKTYAQLITAFRPAADESETALIKRIKKRITDAAKDPVAHVNFISAHNTLVQETAEFRRKEESKICCKTQHATNNGIYTSVEVGRYGY